MIQYGRSLAAAHMKQRGDAFTARGNSILQFEANERPYWIIRNSCGQGYGDKGEGYAAMGIGYAGLESGQALHIQADPDFGLMKKKYAEPVTDGRGNVLAEKVTPVGFAPALETAIHERAEAAAAAEPRHNSILEDFMDYIKSSAVETGASVSAPESPATSIAADRSQRAVAASSVRVHE